MVPKKPDQSSKPSNGKEKTSSPTSEKLCGKDRKSEKFLPTHNPSEKGQDGSTSEKLHGKDEKSGSTGNATKKETKGPMKRRKPLTKLLRGDK